MFRIFFMPSEIRGVFGSKIGTKFLYFNLFNIGHPTHCYWNLLEFKKNLINHLTRQSYYCIIIKSKDEVYEEL